MTFVRGENFTEEKINSKELSNFLMNKQLTRGGCKPRSLFLHYISVSSVQVQQRPEIVESETRDA